jgi:MerR family transcriptional regulator/heat shock protein HspR
VNEFIEYIQHEFSQGREDEFEMRHKALIRLWPAKIIRVDQEKKETE